jgi:predicted RNA-binding protein with TRAM domain
MGAKQNQASLPCEQLARGKDVRSAQSRSQRQNQSTFRTRPVPTLPFFRRSLSNRDGAGLFFRRARELPRHMRLSHARAGPANFCFSNSFSTMLGDPEIAVNSLARMIGFNTTLTIDRFGERGEGIAQSPDGLIFVPYALAGETIVAKVDGSRGTLAEVLTPSPDRIAPFCRYFSRCGGCAVQTPAADSYARWKRDLVTSALRRVGLTNEVLDLAEAHGACARRCPRRQTGARKSAGAGRQAGKIIARAKGPVTACP